MKVNKYIKGIVRYLYRTAENKIIALVLVLGSLIPMMIDGDATALVFMSMIAIPLFFANENCICTKSGDQ